MNAKQSYTPGPWKVNGPAWEHNTSPRVWTQTVLTSAPALGHRIGGFNQQEVEANARLIAAAPELLAALQLLHDNLAEYQRINNIGGYDNHDMQMARAALAKAGAA